MPKLQLDVNVTNGVAIDVLRRTFWFFYGGYIPITFQPIKITVTYRN